MKKFFALLLSAVLLLGCFAFFTGCGSSDKLRVINFRPEDKAFYDWMNAEFTKETGIKVVYEAVDTMGFSNLLNSRLKAKAVDVIGTQSANVSSKELVEVMHPLNDLKYSDGSSLWDNLLDESKEQVKLNDNYLVASLNDVSMLVYYKKDMVSEQALGIDYANDMYPTTWSEFEATMIKCKSKYGNVFAFGGLESWPMSMVTSMIEANTVYSPDNEFYLKMALGEEGYDFGHPLYRDFFNKFREVARYINSVDKGVSYSRQPNNFATRDYPLMLDGTWSYNSVVTAKPELKSEDKLGFFPLPANDVAALNETVSIKGGAGFSIVKDSEKKDKAKKYIEFHFRPDVYQRYIDFVCSSPTVKNVSLTDKVAASMYKFPGVVTAENRWIPGVQGTEWLRNIGFDFVGGGSGVDAAVNKMNSSYYGDANVWTKASALQDWFDRFFPGNSRKDKGNL